MAVILIHTSPRYKDFAVLIRPFLNFGVALFLFLSGYLTKLEHGEPDWIKFYTKRITRVFFPYLLWTIIYTVLLQSPDRILFNVITARTAAHFYFIPVYIQFVLLTPLLWRLSRSRFFWAGFLVAPISVALFVYPCVLSGQELPDKLSIIWNLAFLGWTSFYYLGLCLGNAVLKPVISPRTACWILLPAILLQILEGFLWKNLQYYDPGSQLKLSAILTSSIVLILAYYYLSKDRGRDLSLIRKIGDWSFGIYLVHLLIQTYLWRIPGFSAIPYPVNSLIELSISSLIILTGRVLIPQKVGKYLGFY